VIDLPGEKVKNAQPLRYTLLPESGRLIEEYLAQWQHRWCGHGVPWLFPERGLARATTKIGLANLVHNMRRLLWLQRQTAPT
jgi:hypothetical protein